MSEICAINLICYASNIFLYLTTTNAFDSRILGLLNLLVFTKKINPCNKTGAMNDTLSLAGDESFFSSFFFFAGGFTAHGSMITKQKQPCEIAVVLSSRKFFF